MAEAPPPSRSNWTSQVLCRYYMHGVCKEGGNCRYSHDMGHKPSQVCRYYQKGSCSYGDRCRFDHVKPKANAAESNKFSGKGTSGKHSSSMTSLKPAPIRDKGETNTRLTPLRKQNQSADSGLGEEPVVSPTNKDPEAWIKAAEFVPGQLWQGTDLPSSYSMAAQSGLEGVTYPDGEAAGGECLKEEICPFAAHGECRYGENCTYMHGDVCDICGRMVLHPTDQEQRRKHEEECIKEHMEDMELSFAVARSKDKTCGICMEIVVDKTPSSEQRFGILSNCNHCFCLSCIRKWRAAKQFEHKIVRACPECRVTSDFVTPSRHWVEDQEDKQKLIQGYKSALSAKPCKYFDQGRGECPFNENCFYKHAYPDGRIASPKPRRRRRRANADGDLDFIQRLILWDFFEERNSSIELSLNLEHVIDDILFHAELLEMSSDSDDFSDDDFY